MNQQQPPFFNRGPAPAARLVFFLALSVAAMITDLKFHALDNVRQSLSVLIYPFQEVMSSPARAVTQAVDYFGDQDRLLKENLILKQQLLDQSAQLQHGRALQDDHEHLLGLMNARQRLGDDAVMVEIVHTRRNPFNRKVTVDKGSNDRVRPGLAVIDGLGVVGQITAVNPFSSEITLITDQDQAVPVMVSRNGLRAVVFGAGGEGGLTVPFLPANADIRKDDVLVTSGIDGTYPPGLAVGTVTGIENNAGYVFPKISAAPLAGVENHKYLLVLTNHPATSYPKVEPPAEQKPNEKNEGRKARNGRSR